MKKLTAASFVMAILSGAIFRGSFCHTIFTMWLLVFIGTPLTLFLVFWFALSLRRSGEIPSELRRTSCVVVIFGGTVIFSYATGFMIHRWEIRNTRQFVADAVVALDDYHDSHGSYPSSLNQVGLNSTPRMLAESVAFTSTAEHFRFEYWDSAGLMDGYLFDSSNREWIYFD